VSGAQPKAPPAPFVRRRRRHKAAGSRVLATGLSAGALFGVVGAIGGHAAPLQSGRRLASAPRVHSFRTTVHLAAPPTTIVWRTVHRVVVVVDPPVTTAQGSGHAYAAAARSYAPAAAPTPIAMQPAPVVVAVPAPTPAPAPAPSPAPTCSGSKCP
jgi:hypothetical protein